MKTSHPPRRRLAALAALAVPLGAALLLAACGQQAPAPEPVRSVKVTAVGASGLEAIHEYSGEVRARVESRLGFRVAGKVTRRPAELGRRVRPGEVLAQLDPQDYRLAAEAARAQVEAARTNRDLAAADFRRFSALREQNFISGAELERRTTTLKAAQAQLDQAEAQLAAQGNQARYTTLVADVAGVVTAVEAEPGQVVAAGTPIVRIAQDGPRDVVFSVGEDKVGALRTGGEVRIRPWAGGTELQGRIREIAASADPVTRTYGVKVGLDAAEQPPLGATMTVVPQALAATGVQVIKLPTSALRQEGRGSAVWVLDRATMTVRLQPVQVAGADGNAVVIASGLQPGMLVVTAGVHVLAPGQKVAIWQDPRPAAVADRAVASQPSK